MLVEEAANGAAVIDTLRREIPGLMGVRPEGGKFARASAAQPRVEAGQVYLPAPTWPNGRARPDRAWVDEFVTQLAAFPGAAHDDDVDAFTQLVAYASPLAAARRTQRMIFTRRSRPELPPRMIF